MMNTLIRALTHAHQTLRYSKRGGRARLRATKAVLTLGLLSLVLATTGVYAEELDRIVAVVNDDVVLGSELQTRVRAAKDQMLVAGVTPPDDDIVTSQVIERLIMESIQLQMGARGGVRVSDEELTQTITNIATQNELTLDQFRAMLQREGLEYRQFREDVWRQLIVNKVQQAQVERRIFVSDQELNNWLSSNMGKLATADDFRVGHILLAVEENAGPSVVDAAEEAAAEIFQALQDGADFCALAVTHSAGQRALDCGDLGWKKPAELPTLFAEAVVKLKVGETLPPIRSPSGFHIVQLRDRRGVSLATAEETHVRHILIRPSEIRTAKEALELIRELDSQLDSGADFASLARTYSDDPGSALKGGDLDWSLEESFVPEFAANMKATEIGSRSEPFQTEFGWHILEVLGRREADLSDDYRRGMALQALRNRRFEEELQAWLREIRDEAYVEIKI